MTNKTALIFGVTGQDGSYLAEELLRRDYFVHGVRRRSSTDNLWRISGLQDDPKFLLHTGDITDYASVAKIITQTKPDHVYNLAAQSHVGTSFSEPFSSIDITLKGCLNILEVIKTLHPCRMYQASSSEMFGNSYTEKVIAPPGWKVGMNGFLEPEGYNIPTGKLTFPLPTEKYQNENTKMEPCSPYAVAKLAAYNLTKMYRSSYGLFVCNGILFNHEGCRRGNCFVTKKITDYIGRLRRYTLSYDEKFISFDKLKLGNLNSYRDWGHAKDYVHAMVLMMEADEPDDYVVATGDTHMVKDFLIAAFTYADMKNEIETRVEIDSSLIRPNEVNYLKGDATKIRTKLGWKPTINFDELVQEMVDYDIKRYKK